MKKNLLFFAFVFITSCALLAQSTDETFIRKILTEQTRSWNDGNIEAFMKTYWKSDSLMFIGKNGVTYGWQQTMDNYKKGYPDTAAMGHLHFDLVEVKRLSLQYYFVVGKWYLERSIGNINGAFTLLLKKVKNRWVIVADHSS